MLRGRLLSMLLLLAFVFVTLFGRTFTTLVHAEKTEEEQSEETEEEQSEETKEESSDSTEETDDETSDAIHELSPIDKKGAAKIDKFPAIDKDETWTICIYMTGSNLEDGNRNSLSDLCDYMSEKSIAEHKAAKYEKNYEMLMQYEEELSASGLDFPAFYYEPEPYLEKMDADDNSEEINEFYGAATKDISEMTSGIWSDNIKIVVQTTGAKFWKNQMVNPNRTQRFEYYKGNFHEVDNLPAQDGGDPETLTGFLRYCKDNYESDHRMLVLWNHGGGPFGYGHDSIFDGFMSLREMRSALRNVYLPNINNPAFDIIGCDACLMSNLDVTHYLYGFADYYCVSEEVEPGDGWDYGPFLKAMTEDPTMSPAKVGRAIADAYTDFYMVDNLSYSYLYNQVTFSVIDARKAEELYKAYCDLAKVQLLDSLDNPGVLVDIERCAERATCYAMDAYNSYNLCDIGNYVDYMIDNYPDECSKIKDLVGETVLYHRENGWLEESEGISVYIPFSVDNFHGLLKYLDYLNNVCDDRSTIALYYYKQSGCLNEKLEAYVKTLTDKKPEVLNLDEFKTFATAEPKFDDVGYLIPISEKLQELIVDYNVDFALVDESNNQLINLGTEYGVYLDDEGNLASNFDGYWIHMDGIPLYLEPIGIGMDYAQYRAHVNYNSEEAYLVLTRDLNTDEIFITGIKPESDVFSSEANTRSCYDLEEGAIIAPIYQIMDMEADEAYYMVGDDIKYSKKTNLEYQSLENGKYAIATRIIDQRGDSYYGKVISVSVSDGQMKDWQVDTNFYGSAY